MSLVIRDCEERDLEAIQRIYTHYVLTSPVTFEEEVPDVAEMGRRRAAIIAGGHAYLVAERDGDVLGYAYASAYRPRSAYRFTVEDSVYLRADCARQGIGTALLVRLIERCQARGIKRMIGIIGDHSPGSVALHASLGFTLVGHLTAVGCKFGRWYDTTLMERDLSS